MVLIVIEHFQAHVLRVCLKTAFLFLTVLLGVSVVHAMLDQTLFSDSSSTLSSVNWSDSVGSKQVWSYSIQYLPAMYPYLYMAIVIIC